MFIFQVDDLIHRTPYFGTSQVIKSPVFEPLLPRMQCCRSHVWNNSLEDYVLVPPGESSCCPDIQRGNIMLDSIHRKKSSTNKKVTCRTAECLLLIFLARIIFILIIKQKRETTCL